MAGFEVFTNGRFWVFTEASFAHPEATDTLANLS